ncbi:MAG: ABC transporter permease [Clostridiales bacterium]|nr:ABC transporter permease [Clostridiales bacterium]
MAMKTFDIIYLAALNLYRRLARSLLTVVGVIIGTTSIVIMIAIGLTNLAQFNEMLEGTELTKIQVMGDSRLSHSAGNLQALSLNDAAISALYEIEHVDKVIPLKSLQMYAKADRYHANHLNVVAIPTEDIKIMAELEKGSYPSLESPTNQVIMGMGIAGQFIQTEDDYMNRDYMGPDLDWLNTHIDMYLGSEERGDDSNTPSSRRYIANVVGIIEGESEENPNYDIYIGLDKAKKVIQENHRLARELNIELNSYDMAYVYADKMDNVKSIVSTIKNFGFDAYSDTEWIDEMQRQQRAQQGQLAAIGFISLIVSAIGIANTMMTGVLERRREIGVMKVIGVAMDKIRSVFLVEAAMIGLIGGLAGVILSHIFAYILSTNTSETVFLGMYFRENMKIIIPLWLDMASIGIAIVVGIVAGIFPANRATKMSPLDSIRG